jgi:GT2 family glycosyltransferase
MVKNKKQTKNLITIIIVTYKSAHLIQKTLANIINQGFRIIIVDNGSNDNVEEILDENIKNKEVEFIAFENNCGFGRANNFVLEKTNSEYAFILNPDCFIDSESINNMASAMNKDQNIALANPCFVGQDHKKEKVTNDIENISFVCGGAMMMRIKIFQKIGFFDKNLFLYGEDDDISGRVIENGYKSILVKNAFAYHPGSKSSATSSKNEDYRLLYFRSYHQGWGKAYLKRKKKSIFKIILKTIHRLFLSIYYLIFELNKEKSLIRFALFMGSMANLLKIDCFNKNNKEIRLKK